MMPLLDATCFVIRLLITFFALTVALSCSVSIVIWLASDKSQIQDATIQDLPEEESEPDLSDHETSLDYDTC